ncbi:MAG: type II toxin-antitoxin system PemK/MazF family toxin [Acidobacteriota bacterium]
MCLFMLDKKRPALVISSDALNRHALDVCIVPISTVEHKTFRLRLCLRAGEGNIPSPGHPKPGIPGQDLRSHEAGSGTAVTSRRKPAV